MKNKLLFAIIFLALLLRLPLLDKNPAGLNADEASIGYNAYSLLQTGRDEHGTVWPLVFRSFDDYKPAIYFYLVLPFVALLGPTVWAVRLPSALLGGLSVLFIYLLVNKLFPDKLLKIGNWKLKIGHFAAAMLATSPWHLHFSRGGWEVNAASFFLVAGLYFLIRSLDRIKNLYLSGIFLVISLYTYHSLRVIVPLLLLAFIFIYLDQIKKVLAVKANFRPIAISIGLGLLLLIPLALQFTSSEGRSRFSGVSVFADEGPLWEALELRRGHESGSFFARLVHNKYESYAIRFGQNYLSHFSPRFLFIIGDEIARSKVPGMGQAYLWTAPFFILGLFLLVKRGDSSSKFVLAWLLIAPLAAALTFQSPHALRAQNMVFPLTLVTVFGLYELLSYVSSLKTKYLFAMCYVPFAILPIYELARYLHEYYIHYPKELPFAWQYGFDQIAAKVKETEDKYDKIIISDRYDQPYILLAFYLKYPPEKLQKEIVLTARDKFGFSTVRNFSKYEFHRVDWGKDSAKPNTLIVAADEGAPDELTIDRIYDPAGRTLFRLFDTNKLK